MDCACRAHLKGGGLTFLFEKWQPFSISHFAGRGARRSGNRQTSTPEGVVSLPYCQFVTHTPANPLVPLPGSDDPTHWELKQPAAKFVVKSCSFVT